MLLRLFSVRKLGDTNENIITISKRIVNRLRVPISCFLCILRYSPQNHRVINKYIFVHQSVGQANGGEMYRPTAHFIVTRILPEQSLVDKSLTNAGWAVYWQRYLRLR